MNTEPEKAPVDWEAVTAEEWAQGIPHVAKTYGVSRQSAHAAKARMDRRAGKPPVTGRPKKARPADLDATLSTAKIAELYGVSWPTANAWKNQA